MANKSKFDELTKRKVSGGAATAPEGKVTRRNNPDYTQISAYLPVELYQELGVKLVITRETISEAVEEGIRLFLKQRK